MIPSLSSLEFNDDGFYAHSRAIERIALALSQLGVGADNPALMSNPGGTVTNVINGTTTGGGGGGGTSTIPASGVTAGSYGSGASTYEVPFFTVGDDGRLTVAGEYSLPFLGTLAVPVFNNGGNARGTGAVDWQQSRSAATQVASGDYSIILGGSGNTAIGDHAIAGGDSNVATGSTFFTRSAIAIGSANDADASDANADGGVICIGVGNTAATSTSSTGSICLGNDNECLEAGIAIGNFNSISTLGGWAFGAGNILDGGIAIGAYNASNSASIYGSDNLIDDGTTSGVCVYGTGNRTHASNASSESTTLIGLYNELYDTNHSLVAGECLRATGEYNVLIGYGDSDLTVAKIILDGDNNVYVASNPRISRTIVGSNNGIFGIDDDGGSNSATWYMDWCFLLGADGTTDTTPLTGVFIGCDFSSTAGVPTITSTSTTYTGDLQARQFGCNGKTPQASDTVSAAISGTAGGTYTATEQGMINNLKTLVNELRTALIDNGICV